MVISKIAEVLAEIIIVMSIGYYIAKIRIAKEENFKMLADLIILVAAPALILYSMYSTYTPQLLKTAYIVPFVGALIPLLTLITSVFIFKLFKVPYEMKNVLYVISSFSNTVFLGLPLNLAVFGAKSIPFVILYDLGHTTLFWTLGVWVLSNEKSFDIKGLKKLINPPVLSLILSLMIVLSGLKIPDFILKSSQMIGNITVPLAMMFIGMNMAYINAKEDKAGNFIYVSAIVKLILSPAIAFLIVSILNIPPDIKKILILEAAMPTMLNSAIVARQLNEKNGFASFGAFIMNLLAVLSIPIVLYAISL